MERQAGPAALGSGKVSYYSYMMGLLGGGFSHSRSGQAEQACFRMPVCA